MHVAIIFFGDSNLVTVGVGYQRDVVFGTIDIERDQISHDTRFSQIPFQPQNSFLSLGNQFADHGTEDTNGHIARLEGDLDWRGCVGVDGWSI